MTEATYSSAVLAGERGAVLSDPTVAAQLHRLETIGRLVPGIAHEVNTPIQFVGDSIHFVHMSVESLFLLVGAYERFVAAALAAGVPPELVAEVRAAEDDADLDYIRDEIPLACERATMGLARIGEIVRALQGHARIGASAPAEHDLHRIVQEALVVTRNETKYIADVVTDLGPSLRAVCDASAIRHVLIGLIVNAAESIRETAHGTGRQGRIEIRLHGDGTGASFTVSDDGGGVAADVLEQVFTPNFTTRPEPGRGRGLAIARAIVERHGGRLELEAGSGPGATFRFTLPLDVAPNDSGDPVREAIPELCA